MKINKLFTLVLLSFFLSSCVVSTAAKVVKTTAKIGYSAVKGTVKGVGWAVSKAKGKIDEDRMNGTWKIVGIYNGTFEEFENDSDPDNNFTSECAQGFEQIVFKAKKSKFKPVHCSSDKEDWIKYKYKYGKNPQSNERENYFEYHSNRYITLVDVTSKTMVLEGNLVPSFAFSGAKLYLLEKAK